MWFILKIVASLLECWNLLIILIFLLEKKVSINTKNVTKVQIFIKMQVALIFIKNKYKAFLRKMERGLF